MNTQNLVKKTLICYRNNGFICTVKRIWYSLKPFTYRTAIMYHKQLINSNFQFSNDFNIKIASKEDIDEEYNDTWFTKEQALEKLRKSHILYIEKR